jgi:glycosyltransferase involved in cell wall biosynthesis
VAHGSSHLASVIIPEHNEQAVLDRCLSTLLRDVAPGELDVVVVANACSDATARVARSHSVRVVETAMAGKPFAMRLGDDVALAYPRIYLDADVELTTGAVRALVDTVSASGVLAASPVPEYDLTGVRPIARRLHKVHRLLMSDRRGLAGAGVYCLNRDGHSRVAPFPDVISDDGYVHRSFNPEERVVAARARSVVRPAPTFASSVRRRVRVRQGNRQLDAMGLSLDEGRLGLGALGRLLRLRQVTIADAALYLAYIAADRGVVWWQNLRGSDVSWGTDTRSRHGSGPIDGGN